MPRSRTSDRDRDLRICIDRVVPNEYQPARAAAEEATLRVLEDVLAAAAPGTLDASRIMPPARLAIINVKKWPKGRTLTCRFLDGSARQRRRVEEKARIWEKFANIKFKFVTSGSAEIRISFSADTGSWSALGTDALVERYFPRYQPTMNYGWLKDDTDDEEYERVVVHEFGHALGAIHEHQSPTATLKWKRRRSTGSSPARPIIGPDRRSTSTFFRSTRPRASARRRSILTRSCSTSSRGPCSPTAREPGATPASPSVTRR